MYILKGKRAMCKGFNAIPKSGQGSILYTEKWFLNVISEVDSHKFALENGCIILYLGLDLNL